MTREALRVRRLARLLAMAGAQRRRSALVLAAAFRAADDAEQQQERIERLIGDTAGRPGRDAAGCLAAAANLRLMLQPVGDAAAHAAQRALDDRAAAETRLAEDRARETRLEELLKAARLAVEAVRERRAADSAPSRSLP